MNLIVEGCGLALKHPSCGLAPLPKQPPFIATMQSVIDEDNVNKSLNMRNWVRQEAGLEIALSAVMGFILCLCVTL